jgi:bifunctional non-homologous end joining protein LigD
MMPRDRELRTYRDKRTPGVTSEPFGGEREEGAAGQTLHGAYVVHRHLATRTHYDVRLEMSGALLSFAVPHGPSLDPAKKALAVRTEDHPIEYLEFEDVIPEGEYGGGPMIVWDRGFVQYLEGPAEEEIAHGKLHVELSGIKLRGRYAFVKLTKGETGNEWLFFKKSDAFSDPARDITAELPRSVLSGLTAEELPSRDAIGRSLVADAVAIKGAPPASRARGAARRTAPLALDRSSLVWPASAKAKGAIVSALYDVDLEGVRVLAVRDGDVVALHGDERIEAFYPDVVRALRALPVPEVALDGRLVAFDAEGRPSLSLLAQRAARIGRREVHAAITATPVCFVADDVLSLGGIDVRGVPIEKRRALLEKLLPAPGVLRAAPPLEGDESHIVRSAAALGIAAVIAKRRGSKYEASAWSIRSTGIASTPRAAIDHGAHDAREALRRPIVSNRDKVFWPDGQTKGDLVDYYAAIADALLPYLANRPVILVRYPDGIEGKSFYQWNVPVGMPPWVRTLTLLDEQERTTKRGFLVDDAATLVYIANLGCIPLHVLASRAPDLGKADFLTIDFDVKQSELRHAITLARTLHEILEEIGLDGRPKTSGQTGLHVLVPLGGASFETARVLAELLGRLLVARHPDIATMERVVAKRGPKVYVDTGQTGTTRAIVAPYSVRAVPGATVSTPLAWDEVDEALDPRAFDMRTVPERVRGRGDLLRGLLDATPDIPTAVDRIARILP